MPFESSPWLLVAALITVGVLAGVVVLQTRLKQARARAKKLLESATGSEGAARLEQRLSELDQRLIKVDVERDELLRTQRELSVRLESREAELKAAQTALRERNGALERMVLDQEGLRTGLGQQRELAVAAQARVTALEEEQQNFDARLAVERERALELERSLVEARTAAQEELSRARITLGEALTVARREQSELGAAHTAAAAECAELKAQLKALTPALAQARESLAAREQESAELRQAVAARESAARIATARCSELEQRLEALRSESTLALQAAQGQLVQRETAVGAQTARAAQLTLQIDEHQREVARLAAQLDQQAARCSQLETALEDRSTELSSSTERLRSAEQRQYALENTERALNARIAELEAQGEAALAQFEEQCTSIGQQLAERSAECETLNAVLDACGDGLASATQRAEDAERREQALTNSERDLNARIAELQAQAEAALAQFDAQRTSLEQQLAKRSAECGSLNAVLEARAAEFASTAQRAENAERREQALSSRVEELVAQAEEASVRGNARVADLERHLEARAAECSRLDGELRELRTELANATQRALDAEHSAGDLRSRCAALEARAHELQAEAAQAAASSTERLAALERRLAELEAEHHRTTGELEQRSTELHAELTRREALQQRSASLEHELRARSEQSNSAQQRVAELEAHLAARVAELQGHIDGCDRELERRAAALTELRGELESRHAALESARDQLTTLEGRLTQEVHARDARMRELDAERAALIERHTNELETAVRRAEELRTRAESLEAALAARDNELRRQQDEGRSLGELSAGLEDELATRAVELVEREQLLGEVRGEVERLAGDVERWRAQATLEAQTLDELATARLTSVLGRRGAGAAEALPQAYLDGLGARDLASAVRGLIGDPQPLSPAAVARLAELWSEQHAAWRSAPLEREVVYLWLDGFKLKAGLANEDETLLVAVAGLADGSKAVVALESGPRESVDAWRAVLAQLRARSMATPRIVIAPAELGAWEALSEQGYDGARQLCWGYELDALLAGVPERSRPRAARLLRRILNAPERSKAVQLKSAFLEHYSKRCPQVAERLSKHWRELTAFHAFPEDHWVHLRSTTSAASVFDSLRLLGGGAQPVVPTPHAVAIVWRLLMEAERRVRKLNASHKLADVVQRPAGKVRQRSASR